MKTSPGLFTVSVAALLSLVVSTVCVAQPRRRPGKHTPAATSLTTFTYQVVPLVTVGDGWTQRIVLQNVDDKWSSAGQIDFYTQEGQPFQVNLVGRAKASSYSFNIDQGKTLVLDTVPSDTPLEIGWAMLELHSTGAVSGDYNGIGDMFGQVVFRKSTPGLPDFMCSMILSGQGYEKLTTFFDNTNGNYTGMGIITSDDSPRSGTVNLRVTVRDISGSVVTQKTITQKHQTLYWMNLGADFPETNGRSGTFEVEIVDTFSTTLTGMSLQWAGNGAFTVITPFEY